MAQDLIPLGSHDDCYGVIEIYISSNLVYNRRITELNKSKTEIDF